MLGLACAVLTSTPAFAAWPALLDFNPGDEASIETSSGSRRIRVLAVQDFTEPDYFIPNNPSRVVVVRTNVDLEIDGVKARVVGRPFQMPVVVNGLRIGVHASAATRDAELGAVRDLQKSVRLEVLDATQPWGPPDLSFHIANYRWRSSTYNNTWGALVPYNKLYYHRGEDLGAIPDRLPVLALFSGTIAISPVGKGPSGSNHVLIVTPDGRGATYGHMNYESIDPSLVPGARVHAGQRIGLTGATWGGLPQQRFDPHVHLSIELAPSDTNERSRLRQAVNPYPLLIAAYFRMYPDPLIAVAGGFRFVNAGGFLEHDASRSVARPGEEIASYEWRLHDGSVVHQPTATIRYEVPGLYSEEVIVRTKSGAVARDFAQVRVFDPTRKIGELGSGWFYHSPVRGIQPGTTVTFWNRLQTHDTSSVTIDFGDGSPIQSMADDTTHRYAHPGDYIATLSARSWAKEPMTLRMVVVVEPVQR